jgi:hypothetical protein
MNIESPGDLAALVSVAAAILAGIVYLIRSQHAIQREFRPNGGHSTRDVLNRIERDTRDLRNRLDRHIDDHAKG